MSQRIIFINRFFYPDHSATSQLLTDLAFYLVKEGYQVSVICSHQVYDNSADLLPSYEVCFGVQVYRVKTTNFGRNWLPGRVIDYASYFSGMLWRLLRHSKKGDVVIVKTDPPLTSIFTLCITKLKGAIHTNWLQDLFPEVAVAVGFKRVPKFVFSALTYIRNISIRSSKSSVVIGEIMKQRLLDAGVNASSITVIPNWSDGENIQPVPYNVNPLRKAWNLEGKFVVGYSGNLGRVHEFSTLIDAAKNLQAVTNKNKNIVFIFIGNGAQKNKVISRVQEMGLNNVLFFPYQPYTELKNSLSVPDVHLISLLPAVEGFCVPSKFYGVLAAGRPIIFVGDKEGELSGVIKQHSCGFQVNVGDSEALADDILLLANDEKLKNEFSRNAKDAFFNEYEKNISLRKWQNLIERLV